jgi:hypothetical protein
MPLFILLLLLNFTSCAIIHHVQLSDLEQKKNHVLIPFELKVSELGVDLQAAAGMAGSLSRNSESAGRWQQVQDIISLFQFGPKTGKPVFNDTYTDQLAMQIYEKCPNGYITGLMSVRETASYPIVSGEIIRLKGYCAQRKTKHQGIN